MASRIEAVRAKWTALVERHPWVRWVQRWGLASASFVSGLVTLFIFRQGIAFFPVVIGYLLILWVGGAVFAEVRPRLEGRTRSFIRAALDYVIQGMYHTVLLFLLPIYYASTTLGSRNAAFLLVLAAATLLATLDPWFKALVLPHRWAVHALFVFVCFASLNVGLPLIRVPSGLALILSAALSPLTLIPVVRRARGRSWALAGLLAAVTSIVVVVGVWAVRAWIPPVPLRLAQATFARAVEKLEPVDPVSRMPVADLLRWGRLVCLTAVSAPVGLREPITHLWSKDGIPVSRVSLSVVGSSREGGYRTYSSKSTFGPDPAGRWSMDVLTRYGQLIGRVRMVVTP